MYQTSSEYKEKVQANGRRWTGELTVNEKVYSSLNTTTVKLGIIQGQDLSLGSTYISSLETTIPNVEDSAVSFQGQSATFVLKLWLDEDGDSKESVKIGTFNITQALKDDQSIKITAYDNMMRANTGFFTDLTGSQTITSIMNEQCQKLGIQFDGGAADISVDVAKLEGLKVIEVFQYLASLSGKNAIANRNGNIEFRFFNEVTNYAILPSRFSDPLNIGESTITVDRLLCAVDDDTQLTAGSSGGKTLSFSNILMTQDRLNSIYSDVIEPFSYRSCNLNMVMGDPAIDPGDIVTIQDKRGNVYKIPVFLNTIVFTGGTSCTIEANATTTEQDDYSFSGSLTQRVDRNYVEYLSTKELLADTIIANDGKFNELETDYLEVNQKITALEAEIADLDVTELTARVAYIEEAYLTKAYAEQLYATKAEVGTISANVAEIQEAIIDVAHISDITALQAQITELEAGMVTTDYLEANYAKINLSNIEQGCITTAMIGTGVVGNAQIADGSITDAKIVELTANKITAGTLSVERLIISGSTESIIYSINNAGELTSESVDTIDGDVLTPRSITADKIVANEITANEIASNTITSNEINAGSVRAAILTANSITSTMIQSGAITSTKIAASSITSTKIASLAITSDKIAANAVTSAKIATDAIKSRNYVANSVGSYLNLADGTFSSKNLKWTRDGTLTATNGNFTGTITGSTITGGSINVSTDITVGNNIYIAPSVRTYKGIRFTDDSKIWFNMDSSYEHVSVQSAGILTLVTGLGKTYDADIRLNSYSTSASIEMNCNTSSGAYSRIHMNANGNMGMETNNGTITIDANGANTEIYGDRVRLTSSIQGTTIVLGNLTGYSGYLSPLDGQTRLCLGTSSYYWYRLYSSLDVSVVSDIRKKTNIKEYDERFERMYMDLKPITYELKDDLGQAHCGLIAQHVKEAMDVHGISEDEFGAYIHEEDTDSYSLCYPEFTSYNMYMIQKTIKRVDTHDDEISKLKDEIALLQAKLNAYMTGTVEMKTMN